MSVDTTTTEPCTTGIVYDGVCQPIGTDEPLDPEVVFEDAAPRCTEDMDCWDCSTMGNLICGPTTTTVVAQPPITELPATGVGADIAIGGGWLILVGVILVRATRRK